ncbi:LamG domain-containing protein [Mucilaginibacter roseus]|uniref:LamG domain-containing protein n=1 Tax=Mucilaginibacter roseus TaxID=1528868 RepID=A0ABS8U4X1_9SPHI|nr:LamG domain-containing protein [Mucilaginibacter roseus]MCD8740882.1 LamG domain-containing protein [Mucilaginibacter roseus]
MKKYSFKNILGVALAGLALSSCQKDFDPKSYAPPLSIGGYTSAAQVAPSNLVAHWAFDGNLADSVSKTAGTATGTSFTAGIKGQGLQGALNSYVIAAPSATITGLSSFTMTEWVNTPPPSTGIIGLFSLAKTNAFWGNFEIFIENGSTNDNGKLRVHFFNGTDDVTYALDNVKNMFDKWVNLGVSYNESTSVITVYLNGSEVGNTKLNGLSGALKFQNTGNIVFGCVQFQTDPSQTTATGKQSWASYLTGQLDEVRIYNKALSDSEINAVVKLEGRGK